MYLIGNIQLDNTTNGCSNIYQSDGYKLNFTVYNYRRTIINTTHD